MVRETLDIKAQATATIRALIGAKHRSIETAFGPGLGRVSW